ncbi:MAG: YHYH protein [Chitinophagales bacterium]
MKRTILLFTFLMFGISLQAQSPAITSWLQNTTETGSYYTNGNPNVIENNILVNCQKVEYSNDFVYVTATGIPAYPTGPFRDGNPSQATNQEGIYQFPLNPQRETGTPSSTTGGNIGLFINGVALFDYRDGVGWNSTTNALCGGPGNPPCGGGPGGPMTQTDWSRDAIPAEKAGFDCAKGHPAMGNYHHHQNPSAFKLDINVISDVCDIHDAEGLYVIDDTQHSPLIGFAYDGFPIYGAYGFKNTNGTGGIVRIKSSYHKRNITERTHAANGEDVDDGPPISDTYFLGYFREDYEYIDHPDEDYLDEHNGRFCVTPEYSEGTYAYFATVDEDWNSAYPYVVGPTFYGVYERRDVDSVTEATTVYTDPGTGISEEAFNSLEVGVFPNPATDLIAIQIGGLVSEDLQVDLMDITGRVVNSSKIKKGSTTAYFDVQTVYEGTYFIVISSNGYQTTQKVIVTKE